MGFVQRVELGLGYDLDQWSNIRTGTSLSEWVEYKRENLANFLDVLVEEGEGVGGKSAGGGRRPVSDVPCHEFDVRLLGTARR